MSTILKHQKDNILEYQSDANCNTFRYANGEDIYVASEIDKWLFPGKIYSIPTGIRIWLPEESVAILTRRPMLHPKLEVIPQTILNDSFIEIQVRNMGILPIKILEEEILASMVVIPRLECHIINIRG